MTPPGREAARSLWQRLQPQAIPSTLDVPESCLDLVAWHGVTADLGCGLGRFARRALARGGRFFVGVDVNAAVIAEARTLARGMAAAFVVGDIVHLPLASESIDTVVLKAVLGGVDTSDRPTVVTQALRALRPHGSLVVADILAASDGLYRVRYEEGRRNGLERNSFEVPGEGDDTLFYTHHFEQDELLDLVMGAGFEVVQARVSDASSRSGHPVRQLAVIGKKRGDPL